jgi:hypothetical protein
MSSVISVRRATFCSSLFRGEVCAGGGVELPPCTSSRQRQRKNHFSETPFVHEDKQEREEEERTKPLSRAGEPVCFRSRASKEGVRVDVRIGDGTAHER